MVEKNDASWQKIYDLVYCCGNVHDPKRFSIQIIQEFNRLVPFDQARIYFMNGNGKLKDMYLSGIDKKWVTAYFDYFSQVEGGRYSLRLNFRDEMNPYRPNTVVNTRSWVSAPPDEFVTDYVRPLGLTYSLGFHLFDASGTPTVCFMLDRTTPTKFSDKEIMTVCLAVPQLNNLYKNFFNQKAEQYRMAQISWESTNLTAREVEIATLLCQGVSPANISKKLYIAQSTAYKHIAHIYEKMHVSSRQELLVQLLK